MTEQTEQTQLTDAQWRERLSPDQYAVLRGKGTERAFTGAYWDAKDPGLYRCAACANPLFRSEDKYDSGTGWPSFTRPVEPGAVLLEEDNAYGMRRVEVLCGRCGGHLGHVFDDGPAPTGERYCMNSVSLDLQPPAGG
jgi:peptide-methionine (R)-S-oxide reductase